MSVVIKGFHKPKNCYSCPFNNSDCWCSLTDGGYIDRDDWSCSTPCPIEELPKGHGRLVDADAYAKKFLDTNINGRIGDDYIMAPTIIEADKSEG